MKKSTALGAVLCSAALAVGMAMPAFAVDNTAASAQVNQDGAFVASGENAAATTTVRMAGLKAGQIVATIPVTITIAAPTAGGEIIAPSSETYKIVNGGADNIRVTTIKTASATADLTELQTNPITTKPSGAQAYLSIKGNMDSARTLTMSTAGLTIPTTVNDWLAYGTTATGKDASLSSDIKIQLAGQAFPGGTPFGTDSTSEYVKITYTVAKAS